MSENKKPINTESSAIQRVKKRSMLKRQRLAIIFTVAATILLLVAVVAVNYLISIYVYPDADGTQYYIRKINGEYKLCYSNGDTVDMIGDYYVTDGGTELSVDPATGEYTVKLVVDLEGTEELQYNSNILIFKQMTYDAGKTKDQSKIIKSIEIHNQYGTYTFERTQGNYFQIKGMESVAFDSLAFANLAGACGYTVTAVRLEDPVMKDGAIDYSEYGLAPEKRIRTETDENGNETEVEYDYTPAWYVITAMNGESHKIYIGDLTVTGSGYYVKYEGRDRIYVLASDGLEDYAMQRVEVLLTPMIVSPTAQNTYFNVHDFIIFDDIDYDGIMADFDNRLGDGKEDELSDEEVDKIYREILEENSHKVCHFSYQDTTARSGTIFAYRPYISMLKYADGYRINSQNVDTVLAALNGCEFTEVIKYNPSPEDLKLYGLDEAEYLISFFYESKNEEDEIEYIDNQVQVSKKTTDGVFYAYSPIYNMIVGVKESSFSFLEWDELSWYDTNCLQLDIAHLEELIIESPEISASFKLDDSVSRYMGYTAGRGTSFLIGETSYNIVKSDEKYILSTDASGLSQVYSGDYLITPNTYTLPDGQSNGYLFYEYRQVDTNGDDQNDAVIYYFYNLYGTPGNYRLYATKQVGDLNGNPIGNGETVNFDPQSSSDYFTINGSSYIYVTAKDSYLGKKIDQKYMDASKYGSSGRGVWGSGNIYVTADSQCVMVNPTNGSCFILDGTSCGIQFADSKTSRLAQRAVKIPEVIQNGVLKRSEEIYYPTTENDLYFDDETGTLQVINEKTKERTSASYSDCTIGIWCKGAYYVTEDMSLIAVNEETGDWGKISISSNSSYVCEVLADNTLLDYVIQTTNHVDRLVNTTAMDNFKQFYGGILYASYDGMADLSESEKAEFRLHDDFKTGENSCQLKITVKACDLYGNKYDVVFRLYQYSERRSYITVEALSEENGYASSSENGYGNFFVLRSFADKIIEDTKRMINKQEIDSATKY